MRPTRLSLALALALLSGPARAEGPLPLGVPEPLIPDDMPCVVRGTGLETLQAHLDAFCNRFPCSATARLRLRTAPVLSRPFLVAADGTRPWAIVVGRIGPDLWPESLALLLPVEDADALRQAAAAGMEGVQVRLARGYALVGRDPALLDRLGAPASPLPAPSLRDDIVVRLSPEGLRQAFRGLPRSVWEGLVATRLRGAAPRILETGRRLAGQLTALEAGCTLGERGLALSLRIRPVAGSRLAGLLAGSPAQPPRWIGLAPAGAALAFESHLDAAVWDAGLSVLARLRPGWEATPAALAAGALCTGDAFLAAFRGEVGWQGQALSRPRDLEKAREALAGSDITLQDPLLGGRWRCDALEPWEEGALRLHPGRCVADGAGVDVAAALSKGLLVAAAGPGAPARVLGTAGPLGDGLEPAISPAYAALMEALPPRANAFALAALGQAAALLGRLRPDLRTGRELPPLLLGGALSLSGGEAELTVVVPGQTLAELPHLKAVLRDAVPLP